MNPFLPRIGAKRNGDRVRRPLAALFVLFATSAAWLVSSRDMNWETRSREAFALGLNAVQNGNYSAADERFRLALANNPYDWEIHLALADLLLHRKGDADGALRHYLLALAYAPEAAALSRAADNVRFLNMMRSGELEYPLDAIGDMFLAVESGARELFLRRLAPRLREDGDVYWEAWRERGRGTTSLALVGERRDGFYDAVLELDFPDGTTMSMHFYCSARDLWKLEFSFP